jgi:hypothetical protein
MAEFSPIPTFIKLKDYETSIIFLYLAYSIFINFSYCIYWKFVKVWVYKSDKWNIIAITLFSSEILNEYIFHFLYRY